jgi:capsular exopolysaccharide synthesis family protein
MEAKRATEVSGKIDPDMAAVSYVAATPGRATNFNLESWARKLWLGKWLLLCISATFTLIALLIGATQPPLYKLQTSIELQAPDRSRTDDSDTGVSLEAYIQTQIRIIESRSLLERVLSKLNDADQARLVETPRLWWARSSHDQTIESIRKHISARPSEQAGIVDLSFLSPDPQAGAQFLNSLTQELADFNVERTWRAVQHDRQWTDRQLDELRKRWDQSEQVLTEYSQQSGIPVTPRRSDPDQPASISAPPVEPRSQVTPQQKEENQTSKEENDPKLRQLRTKLTDLENQITQWQALYGPAGDEVQKLKSEAANTQAAIRQRRSALHKDGAAVPSAYAVAENVAPEGHAPPRPLTTSRAQIMAHLNILRQEAESNRQIYESAATRLKQANFSSAAQLGNISVVDPAIPVTNSVTPSQLINGCLGALIGLLFGVAYLAVRDHLSHTFSQPDLLGSYLSVQVLGAIPLDRFGQQEQSYDEARQQPALQLGFDTNTQTAEAYRSIRSSIFLRASERSGPRRLVFTSPGLSEGKTSVVGNLGAAMASAQRRVLLVDGNLRSPGLHKIFGADNGHGLTDLLSRPVLDNPISTRDVIRETQIPDLYLLCAGQAGAMAPELLSSAHLPQLIREFAKGFDVVLIDSPPVLPYADARSLARAADAVVLVVRANWTDRHAATLARDIIVQDGVPVMGAILTDWESYLQAYAS